MRIWLTGLVFVMMLCHLVYAAEFADKRGTYRGTTEWAGYEYLVTVPTQYNAAKPVGLYVFFHGQNGQNAAGNGWGVPKDVLNRHNLIGLNMIYMDGDNGKDTQGKVEAAKAVIAQLMADYPIVPGRGIVTSFSGGGLPHSRLFNQLGKKAKNGYHWPFCQMGLYGSNFRVSATSSTLMNWVVAVGQKEWNLAGLGGDGSNRAQELGKMAASGQSPDFYFNVEAGKGHEIGKRPHVITNDMFERSDLMYAPFVHMPSYNYKELKGVLKACDALAYGKALKEVEKVLKKKG